MCTGSYLRELGRVLECQARLLTRTAAATLTLDLLTLMSERSFFMHANSPAPTKNR